MKKLTGKWIKILKITHLLFAIMWTGGALGMIVLMLATSPQDSHELYMRSLALKLIDDWLIIPGGIAITISGIIYGIWTNWSFFKHRWITVKWILVVFMMLSGTFLMGPWVNNNVYPVENIPNYTLENSEFFSNISQTILWATIQVACLITVIIISVFKPWKSQKK